MRRQHSLITTPLDRGTEGRTLFHLFASLNAVISGQYIWSESKCGKISMRGPLKWTQNANNDNDDI